MAVANSKLRSIRHTRPQRRARKGKKRSNYPEAIEAANAKLNYILDNPHCALYHVFFGESPARDRTLRTRRKRFDGAINTITLLLTMIFNADLRQGFVAEPKTDPNIERPVWERKSYKDLDWLAFGALVFDERSLKRTERAGRELAKMGYIRVIQWRVQTGTEFRSEPGLKFINDKLWKVLGVYGLVRLERRNRDREKGERKAAAISKILAGEQYADVSQDITLPTTGVLSNFDDTDDPDIPVHRQKRRGAREDDLHNEPPFVPSPAGQAALKAIRELLTD